MQITVPNKIPVYGYAKRKDGTLERKLAAYITTMPDGYPVMEIKHERRIVRIDLPVLIKQLRLPHLQSLTEYSNPSRAQAREPGSCPTTEWTYDRGWVIP